MVMYPYDVELPKDNFYFLVEEAFRAEIVDAVIAYIHSKVNITSVSADKLIELNTELCNRFGGSVENGLLERFDFIEKSKTGTDSKGKVIDPFYQKEQVEYYKERVAEVVSCCMDAYLNIAISLTKVKEMSVEEAALLGNVAVRTKRPTVYIAYKYLKEHEKGGPIHSEKVKEEALREIKETEDRLAKFRKMKTYQLAVEMFFDYAYSPYALPRKQV